MTISTLSECNRKTLAHMARDLGIVGWHGMRKDQLIEEITRVHRATKSNGSKVNSSKTNASNKPRSRAAGQPSAHSASANGNGRNTKDTDSKTVRVGTNGHARTGGRPGSGRSTNGASVGKSTSHSSAGEHHSSPLCGAIIRRPRQLPLDARGRTTSEAQQHAESSLKVNDGDGTRDRIVCMVRDPYWLQVHWELSRSSMQRAQAAMGAYWHTAKPILRVFEVTSDEVSPSTERHVRDIAIHGRVSDWYIDVLDPPRSYRVDIGYLARGGKFFVMARSNVVTTPPPGVSDALEEDWSCDRKAYKRIYYQSGGLDSDEMNQDLRELFEQRLRQPMSSFSLQDPSHNGEAVEDHQFRFSLDAELIVYGETAPSAKVSLQGEPVPLRPDGTFTVRYQLPDARQIIPAVALSGDGVEERTIVLAVERNTKELEPQIKDTNET